MRSTWLAMVAMVAVPAVAAAQQAPDTAQVRAVVARYLHGLKFNDVSDFKAAFAPDARLYWRKADGTRGELTQEAWYKGFAASAGKEEEGDLRIDALDVTRDVATAKVVETYAKSVYVDYLNLLRIGDEWRIVNKVYTAYRR